MPSDYYFLRRQGVNEKLIQDLERYAATYPVEEEVKNRVNKPDIPFYGKEILEMSVAALLQGENLLLTGAKATGKNVLAENLAWMFGRPVYNISFHVNTGSEELIGTDTFRNNEVQLRRGSISRCAQYGGFGILDEINMAKNDAISVLHAALDYRRSIDVPGYEKIDLHPATRFIGTMNYGYAGTRELNEALVSRFLVIDMPAHTEETLTYVLEQMFPEMKDKARRQLVGLFLDLQLKAENGEISTKCLDLRGLAAAVRTMKRGLSPYLALRMGIVNKSFDIFEKEIIQDVVSTRIPDTWTSDDLETNPTEYFIDEGDVDGLYANYVSFYIIADTSSNKMPFSSLLSDEEIAAGKMSEKDTAAAESKGDSMAFAQIEDCIYKALSAHADDPFTTEDDGFKLGEAIANDLEAGGFEFGEYTGSNFYNAGGKFSNVSPNVKSTGTYKTPYSPTTVSEVEGITLKEVAIERLENINTYTSYLRVSLEYSIDDGSDVELRNKTYTKLFTYFSQNGYKDTDDATDKLSDTLKFFADGGDRKTKFCKLRDDKFNKIEVTTSNESCSIVFYK